MIKEALHSVGLDLDMTHNKENLSLQLFDARQDGGLLAIARSREECKDVEFFTLFGESSVVLRTVELYRTYRILGLCDHISG